MSGLGLTLAAFFAFAGTASAQGEVTVGGQVELIGGMSDHDKGVDGLDRGIFSRINVGYSNTLDNGLIISASISYLVNQRGGTGKVSASDLGLTADSAGMVMVDPMMQGDMSAKDTMKMTSKGTGGVAYNFAPDVLSLSIGGGFGTVSLGAHAPANCAILPRPIAFVPGGVNATWYTLFSGVESKNAVFTESNYCPTGEAISYATPSIGGLTAMVTYVPNSAATQASGLKDAVKDKDNKENYISAAGTFSTDMGGMNLTIGGAFQTANDDKVDSQTIVGTLGFGGATLGAQWFDNGDGAPSGSTLAAKYSLGAITPGVTYSQQDWDSGEQAGREESALVIGASYSVGGGLSVFVEYMSIEADYMKDGEAVSDDDTLMMSGAIVSF